MFSIHKASKTILLLTGAITTAAISIGGYYLYKYLSVDEIDALIDDSSLKSLKELKKELFKLLTIPTISPFYNETKCGEMAFRVSNEINILAQKIFDDKYPDLELLRRNNLENIEAYSMYCQETLTKKEECYTLASKKIFGLFDDKISIKTIENWIGMIEPNCLEEYAMKFSSKNNLTKNIQSNENLKEAYAYYMNLLTEEYQAINQTQLPSDATEDMKRDMMLYYCMIMKIRVDDKIYLKYNVTEETMRYALKERNLMNDPEIIEMLENLKKIYPMNY